VRCRNMLHHPKTLIYIVLLQFVLTLSSAQEKIRIGPFEGQVFYIPPKELEKGYGEHVLDNRVISRISLKRLNIKSQLDVNNFPGVERQAQFGILASAEIEVQVDGCYAFNLGSDDGSILWIDDEEIISNDGPHRMQHKIDTVWLNQGRHDAKLWYYNAYPNRYGLLLQEEFIPNFLDCRNANKSEKFLLSSQVLFESGDFLLKESAAQQLDSIVVKLAGRKVQKIEISGYTDNVGEEDYNDKLSLNRALSVKTFLLTKSSVASSKIGAEGYGEHRPLASNKTSEGRQKNRRVEVIVWYE